MSANIFGQRFQVMSFGESHGTALGCVIDGMPAGIPVDLDLLKLNLYRRRPGQSAVVTSRNEDDEFEILSGVFDGLTLGTPIAIIVRNKDQRSSDYKKIQQAPRAGHADDVWKDKFGHSDPRGGGRSSGRETVSRVMAGSLAQMYLRQVCPDLQVHVFASKIAHFILSEGEWNTVREKNAYDFSTRFPSEDRQNEIEKFLLNGKSKGESYGGIGTCLILNAPKSLGQPVFHKLKSDLAMALMGVGAVNGVEFGEGFESSNKVGTEFHSGGTKVYGGIRGGVSTGEEISFQVSVKPTSSILDVAKSGRHDPCILIRALPVFESMIWLTLADHVLWAKTDRV